MLKNHLVIIPFNLPWEWSTDYTNQTAYILARENIVVCYMWGESYSLKDYAIKKRFPIIFKEHQKNLFLFYPILYIPFKRFKFVQNLNESLNVFIFKSFLRWLEFNKKPVGKILWIFEPLTRFLIDHLDKKWKIIYDCVDFFQAAGKTSVARKEIAMAEKRLVKEAHTVTAISAVLQKHLRKFRKEIFVVPQGFRIKDFQKKKYKVPKIKAKHPIIGFAGAVNYRLDHEILLPLAKSNPNWNFVIWGPVQEEEWIRPEVKEMKKNLLELPNVSTGFLKDRRQLGGVFKQFDIAMIPYDITQDFNKYCYPMKLFEFFYLGKPVVSTGIEELKRFPSLVKIGKSYKEWERIIKNLLSKPWPKENKITQRKLARENSWEVKVRKISDFYLQSSGQFANKSS